MSALDRVLKVLGLFLEQNGESTEVVEQASAELAQLRTENDELKAYYKRIMDETCEDEIHCTCVPILKRELDKKDETISQLKTACKNWEIRYATLNELVDKRDIQLAEKDALLLMSEESCINKWKALTDRIAEKDAALEEAREILFSSWPTMREPSDREAATAWLSAHPAPQEEK